MASEELEKLAVKTVTEAIKCDRKGLQSIAVNKYHRSIEILHRLCLLYPDTQQNKVYKDYIVQCEKRVEILKGVSGITVGAKASAESGRTKVDLSLKEKPEVKWEDIVGLEDAKKAIKDSILFPLRRPDFFPLGWPRGILLFGPPGCGKTLLAAATAREITASFYNVDAASLMSKWLGESEKNVAKLFNEAREVSMRGRPAIIFIDEIDSLFGIRIQEVGGEVRLRNQFMKEMDSIVDKNKRTHVYVIGATNKPWNIDEAFLRRFQKRIYVPLPHYKSRLGIFTLYCGKLFQIDDDVNFDKLAKSTEGYSGSDIHDVVQSAHMKVVGEFFNTINKRNPKAGLRLINMNDFYEMLRKRRPSVDKEREILYNKWFEKFKAL